MKIYNGEYKQQEHPKFIDISIWYMKKIYKNNACSQHQVHTDALAN